MTQSQLFRRSLTARGSRNARGPLGALVPRISDRDLLVPPPATGAPRAAAATAARRPPPRQAAARRQLLAARLATTGRWPLGRSPPQRGLRAAGGPWSRARRPGLAGPRTAPLLPPSPHPRPCRRPAAAAVRPRTSPAAPRPPTGGATRHPRGSLRGRARGASPPALTRWTRSGTCCTPRSGGPTRWLRSFSTKRRRSTPASRRSGGS